MKKEIDAIPLYCIQDDGEEYDEEQEDDDEVC